jgi:hypothetical protein
MDMQSKKKKQNQKKKKTKKYFLNGASAALEPCPRVIENEKTGQQKNTLAQA